MDKNRTLKHQLAEAQNAKKIVLSSELSRSASPPFHPPHNDAQAQVRAYPDSNRQSEITDRKRERVDSPPSVSSSDVVYSLYVWVSVVSRTVLTPLGLSGARSHKAPACAPGEENQNWTKKRASFISAWCVHFERLRRWRRGRKGRRYRKHTRWRGLYPARIRRSFQVICQAGRQLGRPPPKRGNDSCRT